jgi:hypothetical protein
VGSQDPTRVHHRQSNPGTRINFDPNSRTGAACNAAPSRPGLPLIRLVRFTALITAVEPQQPGYLSHSDAVVHQSTAPHTDNLIVS